MKQKALRAEALRAALASVISSIRANGAEAFRAEIEQHESGDIALALREIEAFASSCLVGSLRVHSAVNAAIMWGAALDHPFDITDFEKFIAANDDVFVLAA